MIAAVVALAVALAASVGGLIVLALKWGDAERRGGDARADESGMAVRLEVAVANTHNESARADEEKRRADAIDAQYQKLLASGAVAGADGELSSEAAAAHPAAAAGTGAAVSHGTAADDPGPDGLLRPGQ